MGSCLHCGGTPTDHVDCCLAYGSEPSCRPRQNGLSIEQVTTERDEARALVLEMFRSACATNNSYLRAVEGKPWRYDHQCTSTYEEAQAALISWGLVKREECVRE